MKPVIASRGVRRAAAILLVILCCLPLASTLPAQEIATASIRLTVHFDPRIFETLDVELICSMEGRLSRTFPVKREEPRILELADLEPRGNSCQIRALMPQGHTAGYSVSGDSAFRADRNGCQFTDIDPGEASRCVIEVQQQPVRLTVYKKWVGPSGKEPDVRISLECEGGDYSGERFINEGEPDGWDIVNIGPDGVLCNVSEEVRDTYRPDIIDCQGLWLLPGKGEECTLLNTKIVKRIEMLNRYGKVVMILLVLGIGLIAVRRFS